MAGHQTANLDKWVRFPPLSRQKFFHMGALGNWLARQTVNLVLFGGLLVRVQPLPPMHRSFGWLRNCLLRSCPAFVPAGAYIREDNDWLFTRLGRGRLQVRILFP